MSLFTPEEMEPSEKTLNFIRQFARTYRVNHSSYGGSAYTVN